MSHDETFGSKQPLNLNLLAETAKVLAREYASTDFIGVGAGGEASVQVDACALPQVADPSEWEWRERPDDDKYPWDASVMYNGVEFCAILTDEEKGAFIKEVGPHN